MSSAVRKRVFEVYVNTSGSDTPWTSILSNQVLHYQISHIRKCASSEDSDQPVHFVQSDQNLHWTYFGIDKDAKFLHTDNKNDQTARMCRLILVFVRRTSEDMFPLVSAQMIL